MQSPKILLQIAVFSRSSESLLAALAKLHSYVVDITSLEVSRFVDSWMNMFRKICESTDVLFSTRHRLPRALGPTVDSICSGFRYVLLTCIGSLLIWVTSQIVSQCSQVQALGPRD